MDRMDEMLSRLKRTLYECMKLMEKVHWKQTSKFPCNKWFDADYKRYKIIPSEMSGDADTKWKPGRGKSLSESSTKMEMLNATKGEITRRRQQQNW